MTVYGGIEAGGTKWECAIGTGPADVRAKKKYQAKAKKEAGRPQAPGNPRKPRHQKPGR